MAVFLLIGKTSALTMNIAGVAKDWLLIGLSVMLYKCGLPYHAALVYSHLFSGHDTSSCMLILKAMQVLLPLSGGASYVQAVQPSSRRFTVA